MNVHNHNWDALAEMLRKEIEAYGRLFGLLEEQREQFLKNDLTGLIDINESMTDQTGVLYELKQGREALVRDIAEGSSEVRKPVTVKELLKLSPHQSWPLFDELIKEVNRLIKESQRQLEKNQMLLRCSWEIGQKFLEMLVPGKENASTLYACNGRSQQAFAIDSVGNYKNHA